MRKALACFSLVLGLTALVPDTFAQEKMTFPQGHEEFYSELSTLMTKYPKSAEQFSLRDKCKAPPQTKSSHHACCEWSCPWGQPASRDCKCNQQCLE